MKFWERWPISCGSGDQIEFEKRPSLENSVNGFFGEMYMTQSPHSSFDSLWQFSPSFRSLIGFSLPSFFVPAHFRSFIVMFVVLRYIFIASNRKRGINLSRLLSSPRNGEFTISHFPDNEQFPYIRFNPGPLLWRKLIWPRSKSY